MILKVWAYSNKLMYHRVRETWWWSFISVLQRKGRVLFRESVPNQCYFQGGQTAQGGGGVIVPGGVKRHVGVTLRDVVSGHGGDGPMAGLGDLSGLCQPEWFSDFVICLVMFRWQGAQTNAYWKKLFFFFHWNTKICSQNPSLYQWVIFLQCFSWHQIHVPDTKCEACTCRLNFLEQMLHRIWGNKTEGSHGGQSASHVVPAGSRLGFLIDQNQQDSLSACSTTGQLQ